MTDHRLEIVLAAKDITGRAFDQFQNKIKSITGNIFSFQGAVATLAGTGGFGLLVKSSLSTADGIAKVADKLGISTKALQEYRFAAEQSGVTQNTLDMALQRFTRRAAEAFQGTGELKGILQQYGIAVADAGGKMRRSEDIFEDLADVIGRTENSSERLRIAFKAFDSEGAALVNMLSNGSAGVNKFKAEAEALGIVIDEKLIRDAEKAGDALDVMGKVISANVTGAVLELAPTITDVATRMADWVKSNKDLIDQKVEATIDGIGGAVKAIYTTYKAIPEWIVGASGYGLVGTMLFGGNAGLFLAAAKVAGDLGTTVGKYQAMLSAAERGFVSFTDVLTATPAEIDKMYDALLKFLETAETGGNTIRRKIVMPLEETKAAAEETAAKIYNMDAALTDLQNFNSASIISGFQNMGAALTDTFTGSYAAAADDFGDTFRAQFKETWGVDFVEASEAGGKAATEIIEKSTGEQQKAYEVMLEKVQGITADTFERIFDGQIAGWGDFFDEIFNYYKRMLAQMAAQAIAQPIIIPIVQGISGMFGSGAQAGAGGLTSAVGAAGGLSNLGGYGATLASYLSKPIFGYASTGSYYALGNQSLGGIAVNTPGTYSMGPTWGGALGAAGWGSLGYTTIGDWVGLPQGKYSGVGAGIGGALGYAGAGWLAGAGSGAASGASAGSSWPIVGTIVGAIVGGVVGALTSTEKKHKLGPFTSYDFQYGTTGEELPWGQLGEWHDMQGGWADKIGYSVEEVFTSTVDAFYSGVDEMVSGFPEEIQGQIKSALASTSVNIDFGGTTFWADKFEEAATGFGTAIMDQMSNQIQPIIEGVIGAAIAEDISSFDWSMIGANSSLMKSISGSGLFVNAAGGDFARGSGVDFETYVQGADEVISTIRQMTAMWDGFVTEVEGMVSPMTAFETGIKRLEDYFDGAYASAEALGFSEGKLTEIRGMETAAISSMTEKFSGQRGDIFGDLERYLSDINGTATELDKALWAVDDKFEGIKETLLDLGMTEGTEEWVRFMGIWTDAIDATTASIQDATGAVEDAEEVIARFGDTLEDRITIQDLQNRILGLGGDEVRMAGIATRYGWQANGYQAMNPDGSYNWGAIGGRLSDVAAMSPERAAKYFQTIADKFGLSIDTVIDDFGYLSDSIWSFVDEAKASAQDLSRTWGGLSDSITDQLQGLKYGSANPASAEARLAQVTNEINATMGGMSFGGYMATLTTDTQRIAAVENLKGLWTERLGLTQEVYDRPSSEYQSRYTSIMNNLSMLGGYSAYSKSEYDLQYEQLDQLKNMTDVLWLIEDNTAAGGGPSGEEPVAVTMNIQGGDTQAIIDEVKTQLPTWLSYGPARQVIIDIVRTNS